MSYRRMTSMDIIELIRDPAGARRAGKSDRAIAHTLKYNRRTIVRFRTWATEQDLLTGDLPTPAEMQRRLAATMPLPQPPQQTSTVAPYRAEIIGYRDRGMEVAAIRTRLEEVHQHPVSYSAVWRLVQHLEPKSADPVVRVEVPPGSEAQVDFGYAGWMIDPATGAERKTWVFVLVLSWSRHLYAELVFDQRSETGLLCHVHAFRFFGGVPARIVPDNLKAAVVRASFTDPVVQRAYRECAEHYGFLIDPNPPRSPHLKGKVEQGGVHYVKRNFLAGRDPLPLDDANRALWRWIEHVAGQREHGTTKQHPLHRFQAVERDALLPLPRTSYDPATWKQVTVYRDCYVSFEGSYYSAPFRLVGQQLWVRGGARTVQLYTVDHELVATHDRAKEPGERKTHLDHLPPSKVPGLVLSRETCRLQAEAVGPATLGIVQGLLDARPVDRLRSASRVLRLSETYGAKRLERACARAAHYGETDYPAIKRILETGRDREPTPSAADECMGQSAARRYTFARQAGDFVASVLGAVR